MAVENATLKALEQLLETVSFYIAAVSSLLPAGAAKAVQHTVYSHDGVATALKTKNEVKTLMTEERALLVGGPLLGGLEGALEVILETLLPMKERIVELIGKAKASSGGTDTEKKMEELRQELKAVTGKLELANRATEAADEAKDAAVKKARETMEQLEAKLKAASTNLQKQKEKAQKQLEEVQKQAAVKEMQDLAISKVERLAEQASQTRARAKKRASRLGTKAAEAAGQAAAQASKARKGATGVAQRAAAQARKGTTKADKAARQAAAQASEVGAEAASRAAALADKAGKAGQKASQAALRASEVGAEAVGQGMAQMNNLAAKAADGASQVKVRGAALAEAQAKRARQKASEVGAAASKVMGKAGEKAVKVSQAAAQASEVGAEAASQAAALAVKATGKVADQVPSQAAEQVRAGIQASRERAHTAAAQAADVARQAKAQAEAAAGRASEQAAAKAKAAQNAVAKAKAELASRLPSRREAEKQKEREAEKKNLIEAHEALVAAQKEWRVTAGMGGVTRFLPGKKGDAIRAKWKRRQEAKRALKEKQKNFQELVNKSTMSNSHIAHAIEHGRVSKATAALEAARVAEQEARKNADATKAPLEQANKARKEAWAALLQSQDAHKAALMDENADAEAKKKTQDALQDAEKRWREADAKTGKALKTNFDAEMHRQAAKRRLHQANWALVDATDIQKVAHYRLAQADLDRALNRRKSLQKSSPTPQRKSDRQTSIPSLSDLEKNLSRKGEKAQAAVAQAFGQIGKKLTPEQIRDGLNGRFRDRVRTAAKAASDGVLLAQTDLHGARHQATLAKMKRDAAQFKAFTAPSDDEGRGAKAAAEAALEEAEKKHKDAQRNQEYAESKLKNALADQAKIQKIAASNQGPYTKSEVQRLQAGQMGKPETQRQIENLQLLEQKLKAAAAQQKLQTLMGPSMTTNCKDCSFNQVCVNNECMDLDGSDCSDGSPCPKGQVCEDEVCTYDDDIPDPDPPQVQNGGANALKDWRTMNKGVAAIGADATAVADASSRIQRNTATIVAISNRLHKLAGTMRH